MKKLKDKRAKFLGLMAFVIMGLIFGLMAFTSPTYAVGATTAMALVIGSVTLEGKDEEMYNAFKGSIQSEIEKFNKGFITETKLNETIDAKFKALSDVQQKAIETVFNGKLQEVQKSVDAMAIEAKRLEIQKTLDDMRETLTKKFESEEFKTYIKNFKAGSKKGVNIDLTGVDIQKATVTPSTATTDTSAPDYLSTGIIYNPDRKMHVRDLLPGGQTSSNRPTFPVELTITDGTAVTAEGTQKGVSQFTLDNKTFPVMKIAAILKISEEMLDDIPGLVSYIVNRFGAKLKNKEDETLLYSVASSTAIDGLTVAAQAYVDVLGDAAVTKWDVLMAAATQMQVDEYVPTLHLMHPSDTLSMKTEKGSDGHYVGRAPWVAMPFTCDGIRIAETTAITAGTFLTGDFTSGAQVMDRKAASVNFYDQDEDNAQKNLITVVVEERLTLVIYRPDAFVYGDFASALANGSA
jgi:HK97 family phage major capsid protein